MILKAAFYARHFASVNGLRTIGVLIVSENQIIFAPVPGFVYEGSSIDDRLAESLAEGLTPKEILEYFVERSNSITYSVSKPQSIEVDSMNEAAVMMVNKIEKDYIEVMK